MSKILINASNLFVGGGVQVAVSFIDELSKSSHNLEIYDIWVSSEVFDNLTKINTDLSKFNRLNILNLTGFKSLFSLKVIYFVLFKYKTVFTIFGPFYIFIKPYNHILGFARPLIINPDTTYSICTNNVEKVITFIKLKIQEFFFTKADLIVVELDHVRNALLLKKKFLKIPILVVHNTFSNIFLIPNKWDNFILPKSNAIKIGYLGRNYPHKNLNILPEVLYILRTKFGLDVNFYVTLTDDEFSSTTPIFRDNIINLGKLSVSQCPPYLRFLDGVISPSLLECFSVTPLEALIMGKPIFLSNKHFNLDVTKEFGIYFDPLDPNDISDVIFKYFSRLGHSRIHFESMKSYAKQFSNSRNRMEEYIKIINL